MRLDVTDKIKLDLFDFAPDSGPSMCLAAIATIDALWPDKQFPPRLRSDVISITRDPTPHGGPLYVTSSPNELIMLACGDNAPFQFAYQLAHELGHLASSAYLRVWKEGRHTWIEEIMCGACSVYVIRCMSQKDGPLKVGALNYLDTYIDHAYSPAGVDAVWYKQNDTELRSAAVLTDKIQKLSGLVANEFPNGEFIFDNRLLLDTPLNSDLPTYLDDWASRCRRENNVPRLLKNLILP